MLEELSRAVIGDEVIRASGQDQGLHRGVPGRDNIRSRVVLAKGDHYRGRPGLHRPRHGRLRDGASNPTWFAEPHAGYFLLRQDDYRLFTASQLAT